MAGYNSVVEILAAGKKALLIPRTGPSNEQRMRATIFGELGLVDQVAPDQIDNTALLADRLNEILATPNPLGLRRLPQMQGADKAAAVVAA